MPHAVEHVARFLPSVRNSGVPFAIIIHLIVPGNPLLGVVATFATEQVRRLARSPAFASNPPVVRAAMARALMLSRTAQCGRA